MSQKETNAKLFRPCTFLASQVLHGQHFINSAYVKISSPFFFDSSYIVSLRGGSLEIRESSLGKGLSQHISAKHLLCAHSCTSLPGDKKKWRRLHQGSNWSALSIV